MKTEVNVVRVFVDNNRNFGSLISIVLDEDGQISPDKRQELTKHLGFSETVFINNLKNADVSIYSLQGEIPFAGTPLVGTAWFIEKTLGKQIDKVISRSKPIKIVHDEDLLWVAAGDTSTLPDWNLEQLKSPKEVEKIDASSRPANDHSYVWAWIDQSSKNARVRARTFAPGWDIPEEEANGSGSMLLSATTGRSLIIHHGKGSIIRAKSGSTGIAVGGLVKQDPTMSI